MLVGCASVDLTENNTNIVMAKKAVKGAGASEISDVFNYEGQIFAYLTFRWDAVDRHGGPQTVEVRWFNGTKEVSRRKHEATFGLPPYYVWFPTSGTALGVGNCRVDAYVNGRHVGTKSFTVNER